METTLKRMLFDAEKLIPHRVVEFVEGDSQIIETSLLAEADQYMLQALFEVSVIASWHSWKA